MQMQTFLHSLALIPLSEHILISQIDLSTLHNN